MAPMEALLRDLRHTLRALRSSPLFTFATVAALALGIGASTAIFSVANAVMFRPMPFPGGDRVVFLMTVGPNGGNPGVGPARFAKWQQQTAVLQDPNVQAGRNANVPCTRISVYCIDRRGE